MKEELGECLRVTFSILGRVGVGILRSHSKGRTTVPMSRRAAWLAERASLKLIDLGKGKTDTFFNADRRVYKEQLSALRRQWVTEDLHARRAAYVASRVEAAKSKVRTEGTSMYQTRREEYREARARELAAERTSQDKQHENADRVSAQRMAKRAEAEAEFLRKWMQGVLKDYDVEGTASTMPLRMGSRSWLYPENMDKKLNMLLMTPKSPVDRWNGIARRNQQEEQDEAINARTAGTYVPSASSLAQVYDPATGAVHGGNVSVEEDAGGAVLPPQAASAFKPMQRSDPAEAPRLSADDDDFLAELLEAKQKLGPGHDGKAD